DSQVRQLQAATDKAAKVADAKAKILRPQIEEKRRALSDLLEKENADATQVGRAVLEIRGLERQMRQAREALRKAGISLMTPEQRTKFKAMGPPPRPGQPPPPGAPRPEGPGGRR